MSNVTPARPRLIRPIDAAEILGVSRPQIYKLAHLGIIRAVAIAGSIRIPADEIDRLVEFGTEQMDKAAN